MQVVRRCSALRNALRRTGLFLAMIAMAITLGRGISRADEVDIAVEAFAPALAFAGVNLGDTEKTLAKSLVRCAMSGKTVANAGATSSSRLFRRTLSPLQSALSRDRAPTIGKSPQGL